MSRAVPLKCGKMKCGEIPSSFCRAIIIFFFCSFLGTAGLGAWCPAQSPSEDSSVIRGAVINSVTHETIGRALVSSPDHRFATLTDSEGRFEFAVTKVDTANDESSNRPD